MPSVKKQPRNAGTPTPPAAPLVLPTEPSITQQPGKNAGKAKVAPTMLVAGDDATITADGFTPGEQVQLVVYSAPIKIGNYTADASGAVEAKFTVPKKLLTGTHTLQLTGWQSAHIAQATFTVSSDAIATSATVMTPIVWLVGLGGLLTLFIAILIVVYLRRWARHAKLTSPQGALHAQGRTV